MNKLLLNNNARNHIKIFPMRDTIKDLPESEADRIEWCRAEFRKLQHSSEAKRLCIYKNKSKGYLISVWELQGLYYLVQCIRNEFKTFNDVIYINDNKDDTLSIAKFLTDNINAIMADYKAQLLEARDALIKERIEQQAEEQSNGDTRA